MTMTARYGRRQGPAIAVRRRVETGNTVAELSPVPTFGYQDRAKGHAVHTKNAQADQPAHHEGEPETSADRSASSSADYGTPARRGRAQTPMASLVDADIEAIHELEARVRRLWPRLSAPSREVLSACLSLLADAVERRDTDTRAVRESLQHVLLDIGTGALTTLSEASCSRLSALTGIALPGRVRGEI